MRNSRKVETRRDRKALALDAGMGRISVLSVLAGALCGLAAFEFVMAIASAIGVAINGGTDFGALGDTQFKTLIAVIAAAALFVAFTFGGYVSGRMSRRRGAVHGLLGGVVGVVLAAVAVAAVRAGGADNGLARVAGHIHVATTWHQWRYFGLIGALVAAAAMAVGGLTGGVKGEAWHGKLLARAVDPSFGPEAQERAEARKRLRDAEMARLAAADHAGRLTAANQAATQRAAGSQADDRANADRAGAHFAGEGAADEMPPDRTGRATAILNRGTRRGPAGREVTDASAIPAADTGETTGGDGDRVDSGGRDTARRHRHLLGRQ